MYISFEVSSSALILYYALFTAINELCRVNCEIPDRGRGQCFRCRQGYANPLCCDCEQGYKKTEFDTCEKSKLQESTYF